MFFSVIIPTYNREHFLKISLESVLTQTFRDFELIIVDDGSTDNTKKIVKNYKSKKVKYFYQKNKGPAAARNLGIKKAKGQFLCFLDSDDRLRSQKLQKTAEYIKKFPDYKIFHTEELWYRNLKYLPQKKIHKKPDGFAFSNALKICCISLSTAAISRQVFSKVGVFDEDFAVCEDYEFWLRATLFYLVKLIPYYLTIKEGGHSCQQSQKKGLDKYRFLALYKLIKSFDLPPLFLKDAIKNLEKRARIYSQGAKKRKKIKEINDIEEKLKEIQQRYGYKPLS